MSEFSDPLGKYLPADRSKVKPADIKEALMAADKIADQVIDY